MNNSQIPPRFPSHRYRGADKSLARPTYRSILFNGENISFDASLVIKSFDFIFTRVIEMRTE